MSAILSIEATPNPYAVLVRLARPLVEGVGRSYYSAEEAAADPLAARLFAVSGVSALFFVQDRITVARHTRAKADEVLAAVRAVLEDFFA
jgi:hypothetical protein